MSDDSWRQLVAIISSSLSCSCFGVNLEFLMIKNKNELKKGQMSDDSWRQSSVAAYPAAAAAAVEQVPDWLAQLLQHCKDGNPLQNPSKGPFLGAALLRRAARTNLNLSFLIKRHCSFTPGSSNINIITHLWAISGLLSTPFQGPPKVIKAHLMTIQSS